jgi:YD repeat-containing protein
MPPSSCHTSGAQLLIGYNASGRISHITNPLGSGAADDRITSYEYDASGEHLVRVIEPGNRITAYTYDTDTVPRSRHALLDITYPDSTHDHFRYDDHGRLVETFSGTGIQRVTYSYDSAGGVIVTDATGRQTFLEYGLNGQIAQVRDGDGRVVNFAFDSQSALSQLVGPSGEKYGYSYDMRGNLVGVRDPLRQATQFSYETSFQHLSGFTEGRRSPSIDRAQRELPLK